MIKSLYEEPFADSMNIKEQDMEIQVKINITPEKIRVTCLQARWDEEAGNSLAFDSFDSQVLYVGQTPQDVADKTDTSVEDVLSDIEFQPIFSVETFTEKNVLLALEHYFELIRTRLMRPLFSVTVWKCDLIIQDYRLIDEASRLSLEFNLQRNLHIVDLTVNGQPSSWNGYQIRIANIWFALFLLMGLISCFSLGFDAGKAMYPFVGKLAFVLAGVFPLFGVMIGGLLSKILWILVFRNFISKKVLKEIFLAYERQFQQDKRGFIVTIFDFLSPFLLKTLLSTD
jgi:hypothetical protein